ncbi:MAG: N-6 DNA methylase [Saprospiraceae bacterium]|nr:N-6 DNA methylase [Saprospiraceae bacterium]
MVVGNIPFGMRIELEGIRMPGEEAFLRKAHKLLTENGRVIMLVPYSVLFSGQFQNFRNDFISYLQEIIALPSGSIRNTQIKTALLDLDKEYAKHKSSSSPEGKTNRKMGSGISSYQGK